MIQVTADQRASNWGSTVSASDSIAGADEDARITRALPDPGPHDTRLLVDVVQQALSGGELALHGAVELLTHHPGIDYAMLALDAPPDGADLIIERGTPLAAAPGRSAPGTRAVDREATYVWHEGDRSLPPPLRDHGLSAGAMIEFPGGGLLIASRGPAAGDAQAVTCLRAAAAAFQAALERRRLEDELFRTQRAETLAALAAAVVHDFNNVLTGVMGLSALVRSELPADHHAQRYLGMIDRLGLSGVDLSRQLFELARRQPGASEALDVNETVHEIAVLSGALAPSGIDVTVQLEDGLPPVRAERTLLQQALTNLVRNAFDAMPRGGRVELRSRLAGDRSVAGAQVAIDVVDHGQGIEAGALSRIFDPFFTTKGTSGTGLGLTSVRRVAERHGGRVDVAGTPGGGATFTLLLPAAAA